MLAFFCDPPERLKEYLRHKRGCLAGQKYLWKGNIKFYKCNCGLNNLLKKIKRKKAD